MSGGQSALVTSNQPYAYSPVIDPVLLALDSPLPLAHQASTIHLPNLATTSHRVVVHSPPPLRPHCPSIPPHNDDALGLFSTSDQAPVSENFPPSSSLKRSHEDLNSDASTTSVEESTPAKRARVAAPIEFHPKYSGLKLPALKDLCKSRRIARTGSKSILIKRLAQYDTANAEPSTEQTVPPPGPSDSVNPLPDLDDAFNTGYSGCEDATDEDSAIVSRKKQGAGSMDADSISDVVLATKDPQVQATNAWIDSYILNTRRTSGKKTELSVLRTYQRWLVGAIIAGTVPDGIIDAQHMIEYLKYSATRALLNRAGKESKGERRLDAASLKKILVMLGRVRRRQEEDDSTIVSARPAQSSRLTDFYKSVQIQAQRRRMDYDDYDITENTLLDSELLPLHFEQVKAAIMVHGKQMPTMIKCLFAWNWQCATLNRGDELVNLPLGCIQPYLLHLPEFDTPDGRRAGVGRRFFGVLTLYHETKVAKPGKSEPDYSFVLPHRDLLRCPVAALALLLWFIFDDQKLISKTPEWDWSAPSTWRKIGLMYGQSVGKCCTPESLRATYTTMLQKTSIKSSKKLHLARRAMPTELENKGVSSDAIDKVGHWQGNIRQEVYSAKLPTTAITALAGFYVASRYLTCFSCESSPSSKPSSLARLRALPSGKVNNGTVNFLELLQQLRPFFWRLIGALKAQFPESPLFKRTNGLGALLDDKDVQQWLAEWTDTHRVVDAAAERARQTSLSFSESATQSAFLSISARQQEIHDQLTAQSLKLDILTRRTELMSLTKQQAGNTTSSPLPVPTPLALPAMPGSVDPLPTPQTPPSTPMALPLPLTPCSTPSTPVQSQSSPSYLYTPSPSGTGLLPQGPRKLSPRRIEHNARAYTVLPLASGAVPPQTDADLILPAADAFQHAYSDTVATYPEFTSRTANWGTVIRLIKQPVLTWEWWAPRSLGSYRSVRELWDAWAIGTTVEGVGSTPPLQLVEAEWGTITKDAAKGIVKGRQQSWRPSQAQARKHWSLFEFFVKKVQSVAAAGQPVTEAINALDRERGDLTLNQFHHRLQPKKSARKRPQLTQSEPNTAEATAVTRTDSVG